ncbi:hypothetical protein AB0J72_49600 [Dactylosporangium sp. NPDC049742]|uniref:hypothetical protein n=1 Tax=Dactylosporangium sp. NPDC049742 TaxID=3154737 RepID=UPI003418E56A
MNRQVPDKRGENAVIGDLFAESLSAASLQHRAGLDAAARICVDGPQRPLAG